MQGDAKTTREAIDAFVKTVSDSAKPAEHSQLQRELQQLERRIKTTVGLIADPNFDGIDTIHTVLGDLKQKRDALVQRMNEAGSRETSVLSSTQLRQWAEEQISRLEDLATRTEVDLADRTLVESFVQRIEIDPDSKTGVVYLYADLAVAIESTRVVGGDAIATDEHGFSRIIARGVGPF